MMNTYGTKEAIGKIIAKSGKPISNSKLTALLRELYPTRGMGASWELDDYIVEMVSRYWRAYGWRKSDHPTITAWAKAEGIQKPRLPGQPKALAPEPTITITPTELSAMIREAVAEAVKTMTPAPAPRLIDAPSITRDNDARIRLIEDSIAVFQRDHDMSRASCLAKLRELAHIAHPFWVGVRDGEEYTLYLRKSGHLDDFLKDLPGYLDAIHDVITPGKATA